MAEDDCTQPTTHSATQEENKDHDDGQVPTNVDDKEEDSFATGTLTKNENIQHVCANLQQEDREQQPWDHSDKNRMKMIEWRQMKVLELYSKGYNLTEIAKELKVHKSTISRDMDYIRREFDRRQKQLNEEMYFDYITSFHGINQTLKVLWTMVADPKLTPNERRQVVSTIIQAYGEKAKFLDSKPVLDRVIGNIKARENKNENAVHDNNYNDSNYSTK